MFSEVYTDTPGKSQTNSLLENKQTVSPQDAHHRILDSFPALTRKGEILPLTPEYVTVGAGKTPAFHSKTLCDLASISWRMPFCAIQGIYNWDDQILSQIL